MFACRSSTLRGMTDDLDRLRKLSGLVQQPGEGFENQTNGCTMADDIKPEVAKKILERLARHITPGEWDAVVKDNPDWKGYLMPRSFQSGQ